MKVLTLAALLALPGFTLLGAESKDSGKPAESPKVSDHLLDENEQLKLKAAAAEIRAARKEHDQDGFEKEIAEPNTLVGQVFVSACQAAGVALDKIQTECGFETGYDQRGNPKLGADGKQVLQHAWHVQAAPKPVDPAPTAEKK